MFFRRITLALIFRHFQRLNQFKTCVSRLYDFIYKSLLGCPVRI